MLLMDLAKRLINAHQHPLVKVDLVGTKIFIPLRSDEENKLIEENLNLLKEALSFPRVDIRQNRSRGEFSVERRLVEITKRNLQHFGFVDDNKVYLYLEEALYLLEKNRLEIFWNGVPISIEHGYNILLDNSTLSLGQYRAYKKFTNDSYVLTRFKYEPPKKKIKLEQLEEESFKRTDKVKSVFDKLKQRRPKIFDKSISSDPNYVVNSNRNSVISPVYNLYVTEGVLNPEIGYYKSDLINMFGIVSNDSIPFYKINKINLNELE